MPSTLTRWVLPERPTSLGAEPGVEKLEDRPLGLLCVAPLEAMPGLFEHDEVGLHGGSVGTKSGSVAAGQ